MIQYFMCLAPIGPVKFMVFFFFPLCNISLEVSQLCSCPEVQSLKTLLDIGLELLGVLVAGNKSTFNAPWAFIRNLLCSTFDF